MACSRDGTVLNEAMEVLMREGLSGVGQVLELLLNEAMCIERSQHLRAEPYERAPDRAGYANGFKDKVVKSRHGELNLRVPQVRNSSFYPAVIEKGMRSENALRQVLVEMYVQGVSTRKVKAIVEELCGTEISSTEVSRCAKLLDEELERWRNRPLGRYPIVYLDALYEKVRQSGRVSDAAVLVAIGVDRQGKREVLGVSVKLSEQESHWRAFLESLQKRGLQGTELIVSDDHAGLKAARKCVFPSVPWQRCQFHLQKNAQSYVPKKSMRAEVAFDIRSVFNAPSLEEAERLKKMLIHKYEESAPKLASWMEENLSEGLMVFHFPRSYWRRIRTSNVLERLNREIRRRTRVVSIFPNEASCERLVSAVLMEISEEWQTNPVYLSRDEGGG